MARIDTITVDGSPMRVLMGAPNVDAPCPSVILMCHIGELDNFTEDRIDLLAQAGYLAAAPDIFHYESWIEDSGQRRSSLYDQRIVNDIDATLEHLEPSHTKTLSFLNERFPHT
ncbi:MAG: hypothetical protein HOI95_01035 [Chromatiales bacterium]|jgi:dienelactone hydrolase|nr:hypothetical protein [Chromatiales bacterium]